MIDLLIQIPSRKTGEPLPEMARRAQLALIERFGENGEWNRLTLGEMAMAVIAAMREPTAGQLMYLAVETDKRLPPRARLSAGGEWREMIDGIFADDLLLRSTSECGPSGDDRSW